MSSNMLHYASVLLIVVVWMTENTIAMQKFDRQDECSDRPGCRIATLGQGCNIALVSARCPKTCGTCAAEDPVTTAMPTTSMRKYASKDQKLDYFTPLNMSKNLTKKCSKINWLKEPSTFFDYYSLWGCLSTMCRADSSIWHPCGKIVSFYLVTCI